MPLTKAQAAAPAGWMSHEVALSKHAFLYSNTEEEHWLGQLQCLTLWKMSEGKQFGKQKKTTQQKQKTMTTTKTNKQTKNHQH